MKLGAIEGRHIAKLVREMRDGGYAEATIAECLVVLRAMFRLAIRTRTVTRSPLDELDPAERPRPKTGGAGRILDESDLALLCRYATKHARPLVVTLAYTGLRVSEALGLRWDAVDFVESELNVRGQLSGEESDDPPTVVHPKTRASVRAVPLLPTVETALVDLLAKEQRRGRAATTTSYSPLAPASPLASGTRLARSRTRRQRRSSAR